ncbi:MAG: hypothetical protein MUC49_16355 [Raineya sp.]|jgi:hypothetical protein|nr:hypothetical protein [Raineya sp.]
MKYSFLALSILLIACEVKHENHKHNSEGNQNSPNKALYEEVMKVHDEVMPLHHQLAKYRDSLALELKNPDLQKDTAKLNKLTLVHRDLDYSYKAMDMWMRNFDADFEKKPDTEQKEYLEKEKQTISKVSEKMKASLEAAKNRNK